MKGNFFQIKTYRATRVLHAASFLLLVVFTSQAPNLLGQAREIIVEGQTVVIGGEVNVQIVIEGGEGIQAPLMPIIELGDANPAAVLAAPQNAAPQDDLRPDRLELFDGSLLHGELQGLQARRNLLWKHPAAIGPVRFQYAAVASISLEGRPPPENEPPAVEGLRCLFNFRNGDSCYGNLVGMNMENLVLSTAFAGEVNASRNAVKSVLALPDSYETLYDLSQGLNGWKLPNGKSWKQERGELVSLTSGSMGRKFPRKESMFLDFNVHWNRSFYFNVRLFADNPESTAYGNDAYNLAFSTSRVNLTASKQKNGRVVRETIGSVNLTAFNHTKRKAHIGVFANRKNKTFVIMVNGSQVARWQDADDDTPPPSGDAILLYNQGGSSQLRLTNLSITGWNGDFEPPNGSKQDPDVTSVTFVNQDVATGDVGIILDNKLEVRSSAGNYAVPLERIRRISFADNENEEFEISSDQAWLARGVGNLSLNIESITNGVVTASSPIFGEINIGQGWLRRIECNRHLIELEQYLNTLRLAERAVAIRNFKVAQDALLSTRPQYRGWQWGRLFFHLLSQDSEELKDFPEIEQEAGIAGAVFSKDGKLILVDGLNGSHQLIDAESNKVIVNEPGLDVGYPLAEFGRYPNELLHQVHLSRDLWMSEFEITQAQYEAVTGENPSTTAKGPNLPVENVSWQDAHEFCRKLNQGNPSPNGYRYRLPTSAEWEFACRAKSEGPFAGVQRGELRQAAGYVETLERLGWFANNSNGTTHPVGEKEPNAFGLHDMHGNVWEWCLDHVEQNKANMLDSCRPGATDPLWQQGDWRALRGGCFSVAFNRCRSAYRGANAPDVRRGDRGFRIVLGPDVEAEQGQKDNVELPQEPVVGLKAKKKRTLEKLNLNLLPVPGGSFLMGSPGSLRSMRAALSDDGKLLAYSNLVGKVEIMRVSDKTVIASTPKLSSRITAVDLSPNGKLLLTGSYDGIGRVWNAATGKLLQICEGHSAVIVSVAFSPDGKRFATGGLDGSCRLWDSETAKNILVIRNPEARYHRLSFSPDGTRLLSSGPGSEPFVWDCENGEKVLTLKVDPEQVTSARFSPNGSTAAVATRSNRIHLCNLINGRSDNMLRQNAGEIADFAFSPDATKLLTVNM
ncbi:MAG: SUMF1/EgtB/PvdO family nonheme iron enzyme, partial [Opitutales bacterium]